MAIKHKKKGLQELQQAKASRVLILCFSVLGRSLIDSSCLDFKNQRLETLVINYKYCVIDYTSFKIFYHKL